MTKPRGMTVKDRTGQRYGRLTVLWREENHIEPSGAVRARWRCRCDCGNGTTVTGHALAKSAIQSCGCAVLEKPIKHGMSRSRTYRQWAAMLQRCHNKKNSNYPYYGGRGITVCASWSDFTVFLSDMGECPDGLSIDRIDNQRGYEPGNCRWVTPRVQGNNRRDNIHATFNGQTLTMAEWARVAGLRKETFLNRIKRGWDIERALTEPVSKP